jgi:ABC-type lipoprotein export system ATPase subunit
VRARSIGLVFHAICRADRRRERGAPGDARGVAGRGRPVHELLGRLDLTAVAGRRPESLSGGEEQRLAVARALVHRPAVVLADEPTASLDTAAGQQVAELLLRLGAAEGAAVLLATHDPRLAASATRRVRLLDGRIQEGG